MPKKSKGSKSKRVTLKQKYKIIKKVKEHGRKVRKEARKSGKKPKAPADPGIPKQWPFKQELINELEEKRRLILEAEARKKAERKRAREAARSSVDEDMGEAPTLENLQAEADSKQAAYSQKRARSETAATPGQAQERSRRAFYKEFVRVVEAADVILEVLDARDPLAYRCPEVEQFIRTTDPNKKIVLLLNKIDLVPREVAERWIAYLRAELPTVAFKCSTQKQAAKLSSRRGTVPGGKGAKKGQPRGTASGGSAPDLSAGSECLGADTLLQLLKNYARNADIKTAITVGIVGLPNVGKSSLINSLKRSRAVAVGNTPGVTTSVQEVQLDKHIKLLDSPGIVFSAAASAAASCLRNCVKVEQLADPALPVAEIVAMCPREQLMAVYKIPAFSGVDQFLQLVAPVRGKLTKGGTVNVDAAARTVLTDWNDGRIPYYTEPPARAADAHAGAAIVSDWGADFNPDQLDQSAVLAGLPPADDSAHFAAPSAGAAAVDFASLAATPAAEADAEAAVDAAEPTAADGSEGNGASSGSEDGSDSGEDMDDTDGPQPTEPVRKSRGGAQTEVLYSQPGQFNPYKARSEKKAAKRQRRAAAAAAVQPGGDDSGSDFDVDAL